MIDVNFSFLSLNRHTTRHRSQEGQHTGEGQRSIALWLQDKFGGIDHMDS